jgi:hypothetical protein
MRTVFSCAITEPTRHRNPTERALVLHECGGIHFLDAEGFRLGDASSPYSHDTPRLFGPR